MDDSLTAREYLQHIINIDRNLTVVGMAKDGEEAIELTQLKHPDVVIMDIQMPKMDGYEATEKIMQSHPVPIVIVSASGDPKDVEKTFRAMEAGAVALLEKPTGPGHSESEQQAAKLINTVKLMSDVRVVRRIPKYQKPKPTAKQPSKVDIKPAPIPIEIIAIGSSTGGPPVIQTILANLSGNLSVPVLIVQHIAPGFLQGMVEWLSKKTTLPVQVPAHGDRVKRGRVYFAPGGFHMGITRNGEIVLSTALPQNGVRPSVSYLFSSVAKAYGQRSVGILLTGMGIDGALDLKIMKEKGAITVAQNKESSVVHSMPGEAIRIDAADHILSPEEIAAFLNSLVNEK